MRLTDNDLKILHYCANGLSTDEIANELQRSRNTIKSQKSRIVKKLGARDIDQAVFRAVHEIAMWRLDNDMDDVRVKERGGAGWATTP